MSHKRFFWVNHNKTAKQERADGKNGYIWSPKNNKNGAHNQTYENLTLVNIGDIIFSYSNTKIEAIGIAKSEAYDATKPLEFGSVGDNWEKSGWKVDVDFSYDSHTHIRPKDHMDILAALLPSRYSPIQANGNGNQICYLAKIDLPLAKELLKLCNSEHLLS